MGNQCQGESQGDKNEITNQPLSKSLQFQQNQNNAGSPNSKDQQNSINKFATQFAQSPSNRPPFHYDEVVFQMTKNQIVSQPSPFLLLLSQLEAQPQFQKFQDKNFPPDIKSLAGYNQEKRQAWENILWLRPEQFLEPNQIQLFIDTVEPNDILQGELGNSFFLSTIASLAEWPQRIQKLFQCSQGTRSFEEILNLEKKYGCYLVNLQVKGEWQEIIVDDFIPCRRLQDNYVQPAFSKTHGPELWAILLEKAWAKVYGSYDIVEKGISRECFHDLTGAPTKTLWVEYQKQEIWDYIKKSDMLNYAMVANTKIFEQNTTELAEVGLVSTHSYSLISAYEVYFRGQKIYLVKLRNPFGDQEWQGNFSDQSPLWDEIDGNTKQRILFQPNKNDGTFFMEFNDFSKYFEDCQFCLVNDNFKYNIIKSSCTSKKGQYFRMRVRTRGKYFITVNQKSQKQFPKEFQENFQYSMVTLIVGKIVGDGQYKYIEGIQRADREVWTQFGEEHDLEEGVYVIYVKIKWSYCEEDTFVLSSYGQDDVIFEGITVHDIPNFLPSIYLDHAKVISQKKKSYAEYGHPQCYYCVDYTDDGFAYLAAWNESESQIMKLEFTIKQMEEGMHFKKPFQKIEQSVVFQIRPGESNLALIRVPGTTYTLSYTQALNLFAV